MEDKFVRRCIDCAIKIEKCMGFTSAGDFIRANQGEISYDEIRERCGKCVEIWSRDRHLAEIRSANAFIFDADGVLLDTGKHSKITHPAVAQAMGLPVYPDIEKKIEANWGKGWSDYINSIWPGADAELFNEIYDRLGFNNKPIMLVPGAVEVLNYFKNAGHFIGLVSSRDRSSMEMRFEQSGIDFGLFDYVQAVDDFEFSKPDPRVFGKIRKLFDGQAIYVGDTLHDFMSTRGTDIHFIGVETGFTNVWKFMDAGVNMWRIIPSIAELPKLLNHRK